MGRDYKEFDGKYCDIPDIDDIRLEVSFHQHKKGTVITYTLPDRVYLLGYDGMN